MDERTQGQGGESRPDNPLWTYAYEMRPPHAERLLKGIRTLLEQENGEAVREERRWVARMVSERRVTHLLIVSDDPERDRDINRRIEAALEGLDVGFSVTLPLPVT